MADVVHILLSACDDCMMLMMLMILMMVMIMMVVLWMDGVNGLVKHGMVWYGMAWHVGDHRSAVPSQQRAARLCI